MGVISPSTFDALRRYVNVRLQQGVPIVDADWNELDDMRKFELRAFVKWYIGDGIPCGSNAFRIVPLTPAANDFVISSGITGLPDGLRNVGRCMVDGMDVLINSDIKFTEQLLHSSHGANAGIESTRQGAPIIPALTTPVSNETLLVYIDIWERIVLPSEDTSLIMAGLSIESCARVKREWAVRTRLGSSLPTSGDADYNPNHSYYSLAKIIRRPGDSTISTVDITDLRCIQSLMPPATLIPDLFGVNVIDYREGAGRPNIDVRSAINAIFLGRFPTTPENIFSIIGSALDFRMIKDPVNPDKYFIVWRSSEKLLFFSRGDFINGWNDAQRLTSDVADERQPALVIDNGTLWIFWVSDKIDPHKKWKLYGRSYSASGFSDSIELGNFYGSEYYNESSRELSTLRDSLGNVWIFWKHSNGFFYFKRKNQDGYLTTEERVSSYPYSPYASYSESTLSATEGEKGVIFVCWNATGGSGGGYGTRVWKKRFTFNSNQWNSSEVSSRITTDTCEENDPVVYKDNKNTIWLFFHTPHQEAGGGYSITWYELKYKQYTSTGDIFSSGTTVLANCKKISPISIYGSNGNLIAVFVGSNGTLFYKLYNNNTKQWEADIALIDKPASGGITDISLHEEQPGVIRVTYFIEGTSKVAITFTIVTSM